VIVVMLGLFPTCLLRLDTTTSFNATFSVLLLSILVFFWSTPKLASFGKAVNAY